MGVKTYQAYTMAEALAAAKRDLGADAVILETRTFKRGGLLGIARKTIFELTATTADCAQLSNPAKSGVQPRRASRAARDAYARSVARPSAAQALASGPTAAEPGESDRTRTRRLAQAMAETHERQQRAGAGKPPPTSADVRASVPPKDANVGVGAVGPGGPGKQEPRLAPAVGQPATGGGQRSVATSVRASRRPDDAPSAPVARRFILTPADPQPARVGAAVAGTSIRRTVAQPLRHARRAPLAVFGQDDASGPHRTAATAEGVAMQQELGAIKTMVGQVLQRQIVSRPTATPTMPAKLFDMYLELIGQDLSEELADRIVDAVREELDGDSLEDQQAVREAVVRHLAEFVPVADPVCPGGRRSPDDRPLTIALIGPTGVGKTTTLAKLAASFKLRHHRRVGLVTCDTYRIAAVDQLRTYANIIGLPLEVALTPAEMARAVHALRDCEVILIDTAGRGQNDTGRLDELRSLLAAADPHEVHLVLSSTSSEGVLLREAEAFAGVGADRIVLTKLDEAVSFGVLINVMQKVGKQLSFITTGQEVPDHIEAGQSRRLAELVLGAEVHR